MDKLELVADQIREKFDLQTDARDKALPISRTLIQHCSKAIRAVHRDDADGMKEHLAQSAALAKTLKEDLLTDHPDLYHTGYTQDALKEFVEAEVTCALIKDKPLVTLDELDDYQEAKSQVDGATAENAVILERIDKLYNAFLPLLSNLKKDAGKDYILWPNRLEKIEEFEEVLYNIYSGKNSPHGAYKGE